MTRSARDLGTVDLDQQHLGFAQWFSPGEYQRAEAVMDSAASLGVRHLRVALPWTTWQSAEGRAWFDWLINRVASRFELLPVFSWTPPADDSQAERAVPPGAPEDFVAFVDAVIRRFGGHFQWIELGNPLNDGCAWDWELESSWERLSEWVGRAAQRAKAMGKKPVLAGVTPADSPWLNRLLAHDIMHSVDALGISGFPGTWDFEWQDWFATVQGLRDCLAQRNLDMEVWVTASGYSTWRHDHAMQAKKMVEALAAPADRVYWYGLIDLPREEVEPAEFGAKKLGLDERCYHFGLKAADGTPKFAYRVWRERGLAGLAGLTDTLFGVEPHPGEALMNSFREDRRSAQERIGLSVVAPHAQHRPVLITGGAGFVGSNLARRLAAEGKHIIILDSLHRPGVERNLESLLEDYGSQIEVELTDIRDLPAVRKLVQRAAQVYHFAAQVAVTTSLETPREDFDVNLSGTLNILESLREMESPPPLLFTSTNKVYGALDDIALQRIDGRYQPVADFFARGISEQQALDFHSPYGCSKGAADQYVLDYARSFGLPAAVFRMSCVYGPHQFGTEDQGWVAHFLIQTLKGEPLTLYGDGNQVRDLLYVEDLVDAMLLAQKKMPELAGRAFNMGGGAENSTSLLEILARIERLTGRRCQYDFADWRLGDQRYYVSDTRLFQQLTGWQPATDIDTGLRRLHDWLNERSAVPTDKHVSMPTGEGALQHGKFN